MKAMFGMILALATLTTQAHVHNLVDLQVVDRGVTQSLEAPHRVVAEEPDHSAGQRG